MPTAIVAYLTLFIMVGGIFLIVALLLGRLFRPISPSAEKSETYECGEPPVGSSFIQFDLRFYVVALLFIVFEVELAFFFPPAVVFGTLTQIMSVTHRQIAAVDFQLQVATKKELPQAAVEKYRRLRLDAGPLAPGSDVIQVETQARNLAAAAMIDMGIFFVVLLVGFAYLWKRGDLDWVRTVKEFRVQGSGFRTPDEDYPANPQSPNPQSLT